MRTESVRTQVLLAMVCIACVFPSVAQSGADLDRALAEFRAGKYAEAATTFATIESAAPGATDALLYRAKALVHLEDFSAADQALRSYLQAHGNSSDALYMLGFVLNRENHAADSLTIYTQAAAINPPTSDDLKNCWPRLRTAERLCGRDQMAGEIGSIRWQKQGRMVLSRPRVLHAVAAI